MANDKVHINIPLTNLKNATQRRTRHFLCCSCLGPNESVSDSAITVTLGRNDDFEYIIEKLAIKRIPANTFAAEENMSKLDNNSSDTTTHVTLDDTGPKKKKAGITFSSYYKMVPNKKLDSENISKIRDRTESSIITLSENMNDKEHFDQIPSEYEEELRTTTLNKRANHKEYSSKAAENKHVVVAQVHENNHNKGKTKENMSDSETESDLMDEIKYYIKPANTNTKPYRPPHQHVVDPMILKTLDILGSAKKNETVGDLLRNSTSPNTRQNTFTEGEPHYSMKPLNVNARNKNTVQDSTRYDDSEDTDATRNDPHSLKWKIIVKHHHDKPTTNKNKSSYDNAEYTDSEY